jgi:hypothetical protein
MSKSWFAAIAAVLIVGCGSSSSEFNVSVSLNEQDVNDLLVQADTNVDTDGAKLINTLESVDFVAPDTIQVNGSFYTPDGGTTPGTIDFMVSSQDGAIALEVAEVDAEGLSLDTPVIRDLNDQFAAALTQEVQDDGSETVSEVTITDEALNFSMSGEASN